jgi:prepilin-type N-terminal cleavage/methylation domain-containing protein/prepilin-type processing-associated H-X9-DG protein
MKVRQPTRQPAFTLIELLVVIAVVAVLAAILMAVATSALRKTREAVCLQNIRQVANLIYVSAADNDGNFPSSSSSMPWDELLLQEGVIEDFALTRQGCPENKPKLGCCFGYNYMQLGNLSEVGIGRRKITQVEKPSETVLLADGHNWSQPNPKLSTWPNLVYWDDRFWRGNAAPPGHGLKVNVVWVDGSASSMAKTQLYTPTVKIPDSLPYLPAIPYYFAREKKGVSRPR